MKILWVKSDFLHPTDRGGQIRSLEILKRLHQRHEIHYVALDLVQQPGGVERSPEYCSRAYPIPHSAPTRDSPSFWMQVAAGLFSPLPLAVSRYRSEAMRRQIATLVRSQTFDSIVCDFLFPAPNIPDLGTAVLFQHNVEALIWRRHIENAPNRLRKLFFDNQFRKMQRYEGQVCRKVKGVIAVSESDAQMMRSEYGTRRVDAVPTGVNIEYFTPLVQTAPINDLVFAGSMDWMPNIYGIQWFVSEVLPRIRKRRPDCSLIIAGRRPKPEIQHLAEQYPRIRVTGTVADIRPYLWASAVAIVPLSVGGGTRLKIYEAMAAKIPVVSTTIGAEGLDIHNGEDIHIADSAADFAGRCLELLDDPGARQRMADAAWAMVSSRYSWEVVSRRFEELLV
jgi:glycosyltransferase involved in cell wall biosynthesis